MIPGGNTDSRRESSALSRGLSEAYALTRKPM